MGIGAGYNTYRVPSPAELQDYLASAGYVQPSKEPSMIAAMIDRANQATVNVPTLAQLFPSLQIPSNYTYTPAQTGSYGAGRFTGGLLNAPSFNFNAPSK